MTEAEFYCSLVSMRYLRQTNGVSFSITTVLQYPPKGNWSVHLSKENNQKSSNCQPFSSLLFSSANIHSVGSNLPLNGSIRSSGLLRGWMFSLLCLALYSGKCRNKTVHLHLLFWNSCFSLIISDLVLYLEMKVPMALGKSKSQSQSMDRDSSGFRQEMQHTTGNWLRSRFFYWKHYF